MGVDQRGPRPLVGLRRPRACRALRGGWEPRDGARQRGRHNTKCTQRSGATQHRRARSVAPSAAVPQRAAECAHRRYSAERLALRTAAAAMGGGSRGLGKSVGCYLKKKCGNSLRDPLGRPPSPHRACAASTYLYGLSVSLDTKWMESQASRLTHSRDERTREKRSQPRHYGGRER